MILATQDLGLCRGQVTMVDGAFDPIHPGHIAYIEAAAGLGLPVLCNVSSDQYGFRSGVARFNELRAERLGVPLYGTADHGREAWASSLLSFKAGEMSEAEREALAERIVRADWHGEVYLHEYGGLDLERQIVARARRVHCGNLEIYDQVRKLNPD